MKEIDVEEAKAYTECSDCEAGLYVYDSRQYPSDTGAICFDCLRKRYEALRDARDQEELQQRYNKAVQADIVEFEAWLQRRRRVNAGESVRLIGPSLVYKFHDL